MRRAELEHVLRAASAILGERDLLVIGSASVLASFPEDRLPVEASRSREADLASLDDPDDARADLIDGAIGELSLFHDTFGYYAQGVSVATAVLPEGWRDRIVVLDTPGTTPGRGSASSRTTASSRSSSPAARRTSSSRRRCFGSDWSNWRSFSRGSHLLDRVDPRMRERLTTWVAANRPPGVTS